MPARHAAPACADATIEGTDLYRSNRPDVRATFDDQRAARAYYARYVDFVHAWSPRAARLLDAGCGSGWSTAMLRELGHEAEGADVHDDALGVTVPYTRAELESLPFDDDAFDVVAMHQVLEHVAEPERALDEAYRVLRPGGRLVIVGPNLLSAAVAARSIPLNARRWRRRDGLPRHPFGNTVPESVAATAHHAVQSALKVARLSSTFLRREPDPSPPFHADNDASWFCNPMDVLDWGRSRGMRALRWWAPDRRGARFYWPAGGGTWVVLAKTSYLDL